MHILLLCMAAILTAVTAGCAHSGSADDGPVSDEPVTLRLHIKLDTRGGDIAGSRATGDEYEPDKLPLDDRERMHTVRVIILDNTNVVEHNTFIDLTARPGTEAETVALLVKSSQTKTIILVANEKNAVITLPDGTSRGAADYFASLDAASGSIVDMKALRGIVMTLADNADGDCLAAPLAMSAIHTYYIGKEPSYRASFTIHRAAVKYTFRFRNNDPDGSHIVNSVSINNVASRQYFFPDADFTDGTDQMFWTAYRTPDSSGSDMNFDTKLILQPDGKIVEAGPFYLPEGHNSDDTAPYRVGFTVDGRFIGWRDLHWSIPQTPDDTSLMTDLPRNTHVIVNVTFNYSSFEIDYTVCPWAESQITIPPFN